MKKFQWIRMWRGLSVGLLRDGCYPLSTIEEFAAEQGWPLREVYAALDALMVEKFMHDGETYVRLSGGVIPLAPRDFRDPSVYRRAGAAA